MGVDREQTRGAALRLRLMQFSVFRCGERRAASSTLAAPILIGCERESESAG